MLRLVFLFGLIFLLTTGGIASGQCVSDGNDTEADATPIGYIETVPDWVCPTDVFDYYTLNITQGASVSGDITFSSPQRSTVLRVWHAASGVRIVNDIFTNDTTHDFTVPISLNNAPGGTYYARVFFWSDAAFDHEYTLTLNLMVGGVSNCAADGNETTSTAGEAAWGSSVSDWICADDTLDMWHFTISDPETEGFGTISLDADPGEATYNFYGSNGVLLETYPTTNGEFDHNLGWQGTPTPAGEYYIGVTHLAGESGEHSYTLSLAAFHAPYLHDVFAFGQLEAIPLVMQIAPWPNPRADARNTSCAKVGGPGGNAIEVASHDLLVELGLEDDPNFHGFSDLMIGPNNRAYFQDRGTNILYAWDLMTGYLWDFKIADSTNPIISLDSFGGVYVIGNDGVRLFKLDFNGNELWSRRIEKANGYGTSLWPVGDYVCVTDGYEVEYPPHRGEIFLYMWNKNGNQILSREGIAPQSETISGVAQGLDKYVYAHTWFDLQKFNSTGGEEWSQDFGNQSDSMYTQGEPVIGEDGRIWVYLRNGYRWKVYNPNGTIYKQGKYPDNSDIPKEVCVGGDGRFYVSTNHSQLVCYNDWTQEVWRIDNPGEERIMRIIMDSYDLIYMLYYELGETSRQYHWATVDPHDGEILFDHLIVQPEYDGCSDPWGHIAIGDNGYLVYMNECGFLGVYKPVIRPAYIEFEHEFNKEIFLGG